MIAESIFLGIVLGFIYYELVGITPGGIIVPGYIALYFHKPIILITTFFATLLCFFIVKVLSHLIIIYGRRAFLTAVIAGFLLKWGLESIVLQTKFLTYDLEVIGYIIPGLIANEMRKQGMGETLLSLLVVSGVTHILIKFQLYFFS